MGISPSQLRKPKEYIQRGRDDKTSSSTSNHKTAFADEGFAGGFVVGAGAAIVTYRFLVNVVHRNGSVPASTSSEVRGSRGRDAPESYANNGTTTASQTSVTPTEQDRQAQRSAAQAAEQRQQKFDRSATGRAARTAVNNVKKERDAERVDRNDRAKDWLT